jgi:protein-disulfide isomerase
VTQPPESKNVSRVRLWERAAILLVLAGLVASVVGLVSRADVEVDGDDSAIASPVATEPVVAMIWAKDTTQVREWKEPRLHAEGVTLLLFTDLLCGPCASTERLLEEIVEKWRRLERGPVRLEVRDYPMDRECNQYVPLTVHSAACEAAAAAHVRNPELDAIQWRHWIYANRGIVTRATLRGALRDYGAITDFDARYDKLRLDIARDVELARSLQVTTVPAVFVNGLKVGTVVSAEEVDELIAQEMAVAGHRRADKH